jgi:uncharacterized membrane protein
MLLVERAPSPPTRVCPRCGNHSPADAVFCVMPACHKALGELPFSNETLAERERWHTALADRVTAFIAHPAYIALHVVWFAAWIAVNTGLVMGWRHFDEYPFALLGILLAIEAIFITGFVLISQTRQGARADLRAELDYEVNVRTYRELTAMHTALRDIGERVRDIESRTAGLNYPSNPTAEINPSTPTADSSTPTAGLGTAATGRAGLVRRD